MRLARLYRALTPWRQVAEGVQRVDTNHEGEHFLCRRQSCQELPDNNCKFGTCGYLMQPCFTKNQHAQLFIDIDVIASNKVTT